MSEAGDKALATYEQLTAKVEAKFAEIVAAHPQSFRCGKGCHSCCNAGLTVSGIEALALARFLAARPELVVELAALERADPFHGTRCSFLGADGGCRVYQARPLVCRSHGAPITYADRYPPSAPAAKQRDVCPLNFENEPLASLDERDFINVDTLNTILALLNQQLGAGAARTPLRLDALTGSGAAGIR